MPIQYKVVKKAQAGVKGGGEYKYHDSLLNRLRKAANAEQP